MSIKNPNKLKTRTKIGLVLAGITALVVGPSAGAQAYWYNTTAVVGTQTIQVRNTDNHYFNVAPGRSASNVNLAVAGWNQCIKIKNMQNFATWTYRFPRGGSVGVPAAPGGVIQIQKYNC